MSLKGLVPNEDLSAGKEYAEPVGCVKCNKTGYIGRVGIYEVLEVTERVRHAIMRRETADRIREVAKSEGMTTMLLDGLEKASKGVTSIAEVLRVIHE
jgi:type II secretory ATPase GspE/PulE/Tfp pilus assembly ATPase PilB-like protein